MAQYNHSKNFDMVKRWYENNHRISWTKNAVKAGYITEDEFEEITGKEYNDD